MRIICIDDEELILGLTVSMCKELNGQPEVVGFTNEKDSLAYLSKNEADIALLDINMPEMDGLELAAKIKEMHPDTAIIFLTGYGEYAVPAFELHASGYLMKPISQKRLQDEVDFALGAGGSRQGTTDTTKRIAVRTFGEFEVFTDGKPVLFSRARAKELLAYLVDRQGQSVSRKRAFAVLWENDAYDRSMQKQLDVIIRSLRTTLEETGAEEIFELSKGQMRIKPEKIECDLYRFLQGDMKAINSYRGEYMSAYSWASFTEAYLDRVTDKH